MVFIIDSNKEIGFALKEQSLLYDLIKALEQEQSQIGFFHLFSFMLAHHMLSYHLTKVPWYCPGIFNYTRIDK